jgi:DNA-binding XRE family transcriptional regulator
MSLSLPTNARWSVIKSKLKSKDFKEWRARLGLSQGEAAERPGISRESPELYEHGSRYDDRRTVTIPKTVELAMQALEFRLAKDRLRLCRRALSSAKRRPQGLSKGERAKALRSLEKNCRAAERWMQRFLRQYRSSLKMVT